MLHYTLASVLGWWVLTYSRFMGLTIRRWAPWPCPAIANASTFTFGLPISIFSHYFSLDLVEQSTKSTSNKMFHKIKMNLVDYLYLVNLWFSSMHFFHLFFLDFVEYSTKSTSNRILHKGMMKFSGVNLYVYVQKHQSWLTYNDNYQGIGDSLSWWGVQHPQPTQAVFFLLSIQAFFYV